MRKLEDEAKSVLSSYHVTPSYEYWKRVLRTEDVDDALNCINNALLLKPWMVVTYESSAVVVACPVEAR